MCELNPIELAQDKLKHYIQLAANFRDISMMKLQQILQEEIRTVFIGDQVAYSSQVKKIQ